MKKIAALFMLAAIVVGCKHQPRDEVYMSYKHPQAEAQSETHSFSEEP